VIKQTADKQVIQYIQANRPGARVVRVERWAYVYFVQFLLDGKKFQVFISHQAVKQLRTRDNTIADALILAAREAAKRYSVIRADDIIAVLKAQQIEFKLKSVRVLICNADYLVKVGRGQYTYKG
jgi:hypothetical protein